MDKTINKVIFPPLNSANEDGLLAMGGTLNFDTLISAYSQGIFPWFNEGQPILWWSPDPRMVIYPGTMRVSRSLRKTIRQGKFELRCNTNFLGVIEGCAQRVNTSKDTSAKQYADTWITSEMQSAYLMLHKTGYAHSIETWQNKELVGGLYGLALGNVFFGESMFSQQRDASKVALYALHQWLQQKNFTLIDCQVKNAHLLSLGAIEIPRTEFISHLTSIDYQQANSQFAKGFSQFINSHTLVF